MVAVGDSNGIFHQILLYFTLRWNPENVEESFHGKHVHNFLENLDLLLAIALKSLILQYADVDVGKPKHPVITLIKKHFELVADFTEKVAQAIIMKTFTIGDQFEILLDFVVGILGAIVPYQAKDFCVGFMGSLGRDFASLSVQSKYLQARFKSSRRFLSLPCFVELNETPKKQEYQLPQPSSAVSWLLQSHQIRSSDDPGQPNISGISPHGWLANLVIREALETCITATRILMREVTKSSQHEESKVSSTDDQTKQWLNRLQSSAVGGIAIVHEVLLRRHAMDARYQSDGMKAAISSMFLPPILEKTLQYADVLSELPCDHAVRRLWMGCLLHIFQDAPEMLISNYVAGLSIDPVRCAMVIALKSNNLLVAENTTTSKRPVYRREVV